MTVGNFQKMKSDIKCAVNMKMQGGEMFKFTEVVYVPQEVKNVLIVSSILFKGATMGETKDKINIKKTASK